jgi:hypothetical protein
MLIITLSFLHLALQCYRAEASVCVCVCVCVCVQARLSTTSNFLQMVMELSGPTTKYVG